MFRDGSMDSMEFQKKIQFFRHIHTSERSVLVDIPSKASNLLKTPSSIELREVPTIEYLKECVQKCMSGLKICMNKFTCDDDWNSKFHSLLRNCDMVDEFPPWSLQSCYHHNGTCGHILQVNLMDVALNTLQLTMLETIDDSENTHSQTNIAALFIQTVLFSNPLWDIGLQHNILKKNEDKMYTNDLKVGQYTSRCVCPCSEKFRRWHDENHFNLLPGFSTCETEIFIDLTSFVHHLP